MNYKKRVTVISLGLFLLQAAATSSYAAIYKCTDEEDKVFYHDKPCPIGHLQKEMAHAEDPDAKSVVPITSSDGLRDKKSMSSTVNTATSSSVNKSFISKETGFVDSPKQKRSGKESDNSRATQGSTLPAISSNDSSDSQQKKAEEIVHPFSRLRTY